MPVDERLLDESIENGYKTVLRLYGWDKPTLSLGRNQTLSGINTDFCKNNGIDIVTRKTGGRAVFHHQELTYCFIVHENKLNNGSSVLLSYKEISEALVIALKKAGLELSYPQYKKVSVKEGYCMALSTGSDLEYKGKKLIGSAQYRKKGYILQHGSILIYIDRNILANIFNTEKFEGDFIGLKEINPELTDINFLSKLIKSAFEEKFSVKFNEYKGLTPPIPV